MTLVAEAGDAGKRLDTLLHERFPEFSRARLQAWIKVGRVLVNHTAARAAYLVRGGELISVEPAPLAPLKAQPEELPLKILYEDNDVIAVDKAAGMVVHAGAGHDAGTLVNALLHRFGTLSSINGDFRPGIVHRLDRETSGVLVVARTDQAHQSLAVQFHDRTVEKIYLALVHGSMKQSEGQITAPIARDPVRRVRMTARTRSGRTALTDYRVIESLGAFSLLEVRIGTGRTHQIRVHLSSLGHPVLGDRLYGAPASIPELGALPRFFLHAHRLSFDSPSTGQRITVESLLPEDFLDVLATLRRNTDKMKTPQ